jgi:glycosyltransferase involved in cell wall biosynthesis
MSAPVPRISLVIPTYERRASIRRLLIALTAQSLPRSEYEVIVAIDGSTDGTLEEVERFADVLPVRAAWRPNHGRAAARNAGIALSRGEILAFLDDDMEPRESFLEAHLAAHEVGARRAVLGAVPVIIDDHSPPPATFIRAKFERHDAKLSQPGYRIGFRDFYSGNFSISKQLLLEIGVFDEGFDAYGNEDGELGLRLLRAGVELVYSRDATAAQHYEKDFAALAQDNIEKGKTAVLTVSRHPETFSSLRLAHYHSGSRKRRLLRAALLRLSQVMESTPRGVVWVVNGLERRGSPQLHRYYRIALDYFFWLGAKPALRQLERR